MRIVCSQRIEDTQRSEMALLGKELKWKGRSFKASQMLKCQVDSKL